jgi:hypothetical protein
MAYSLLSQETRQCQHMHFMLGINDHSHTRVGLLTDGTQHRQIASRVDEDETRNKLSGFTRDQLLDMLICAYKEKRLWAKSLGE